MMAKYRITSIPQDLPKNQFGGEGKKVKGNLKNVIWGKLHPRNNEKITPVADQPMIEVEGMQGQPSYWNNMQSNCPPGKFPYNGECITESEYKVLYNREMEDWQTNLDAKRAVSNKKYEEDINKIKTGFREEQDRWYNDQVDSYYNKFENSKKGDKVEPFDSLPTAAISKEAEEELKKNFLLNKNEKGYTELFPKDIVFKKIIDNGFQAEQFKNYWGLDPKQVKSQIGDVMNAANELYKEDVNQYVVDKAIREGKTTDEVISELSPKVGTKSGLKNEFAKPTKKIIDDLYANTTKEILKSIPGVDQTKLEKDRNVFLSDDPQTAWENKYRNTNLGEFLNYQGKKIDRGNKAYDEYMTKYKDAGQDIGHEYANTDDAFANIRANNRMLQKEFNLKNAYTAKKTAENEEFQKEFDDYIGNYSADDLQYVVDKMFSDSSKNQKSKLDILQKLTKDPDKGLQTLLQQKTGNKNQTYADLLQDRVLNKFESSFYRQQNPDSIKASIGTNENNSNLSKFLDVASHPFDAAYYALNPREEMWGDNNQSYRTRLALAKKHGLSPEQAGTMPFGPMSVLNWTPAQALNPFKVGTNLRRGYDEGNFVGALGDEIVDIGTSVGLAKGLNAISGAGLPLGKAAGTLLRSTFSPLADIGFGIKAGLDFDKAADYINKGEYQNAAWEGLAGALDAAPLIGFNKYLKGFDKFDNTGGFNFNKPFNNTNQLKQNTFPLLNTQQTPKYSILNKDNELLYDQYKHGGSLPEAQLGKIVGGLKALTKTVPTINYSKRVPFYKTLEPITQVYDKEVIDRWNKDTGLYDIYEVDVPRYAIPGRSFENVQHKLKNLRKDLNIGPIEHVLNKAFKVRGPALDQGKGLLGEPSTGRLWDSNTRYWLNRMYGHVPPSPFSAQSIVNYGQEGFKKIYDNIEHRDLETQLNIAKKEILGKDSEPKFEDGGVISTLSKKEIDDLVVQGYIIEEID